jgi:hypothetical protein
VFTLGSESVRLELRHLDDGSLRTTSLYDIASGTEWCDGAHPSAAFSLAYGLSGSPVRARSGLDRWNLLDASESNEPATLRLVLGDAGGLVRVSLFLEGVRGFPVLRMWTTVENTGDRPLELARQQFLHLVVNPFDAPLELVWVSPFNWDNPLNGFRTHSWELRNGEERHLVGGPYGASDCAALNRGEPFPPEPHETRYRREAEPGDYDGPFRESCGWLVLHRPEARLGLFAGWEWSGAVDATVRAIPPHAAELSIGHLAPLFHHQLAPGQTLTSPPAFVGLFAGDLDDAGDVTRRLAEARYIPPRPEIDVRADAEFPYLIADSWGLHERIDEDYVRTMIDEAAELGVEVFTLDKGWERAVGDWQANERFPGGIRALADFARERGIAFGLWCAFGNAHPSAPVVHEHPDWLATWDGKAHTWSFGCHALCLGHEPVREWVKAELDRVIREYGVSWFLHDFETIARCNSSEHTHQPGSADYANVAALYEVLDHLRAAHPRINIENCWNGGRMMDFGMLPRHDTSIGDDWARAVVNRLAAFGVTRFLPPTWNSKYMGDEHLSSRYLIRSYLFGGPWILMGDWPRWTAEMRAEAVAGIELYKRLRGLIAPARVYHLREPRPDGTGWDAIEAFDSATGRGVILAHRSYFLAREPARVRPRGLSPDATYRVSFEDRPDSFERTGSRLESEGIPLALSDHFTTDLVYLEAVR